MIVRPVADIHNQVFWRVGTSHASDCCIPSAGWSYASRGGQWCAGWAAPAGLWASALPQTASVLIAAASPEPTEGADVCFEST